MELRPYVVVAGASQSDKLDAFPFENFQCFGTGIIVYEDTDCIVTLSQDCGLFVESRLQKGEFEVGGVSINVLERLPIVLGPLRALRQSCGVSHTL